MRLHLERATTMNLECKWALYFNGVDRGELFRALRGDPKSPESAQRLRWFEEACGSLDYVDESNPDDCNASVSVESLEDLAALLAAVSGLQTTFGTVLHAYAGDGNGPRLTVSLCGKGECSGFSNGARLTFPHPREGESEMYDLLTTAERALADLRQKVRVRHAAKGGE